MHRPRIHLVRLALVTTMSTTSLLLAIPGAQAACHIAGFVESSVEIGADESSVTLTVELQGRQPSCEGTVDWATEDGSAIAGTDYEADSGTLTFVAEDDRVEDITITILEGASAGDFQVVLSNATGSISGTASPATVTITSDATPTEPAATDDTTTSGDETTPPITDDPTEAGDEPDEGTSLPWIPILVVVIVLALLVGWYIARRTPPTVD